MAGGRQAGGGNRVRIIGGDWRSRVVTFPDREGLRPTPDRVRETLFNWLGQTLDGKVCLDLFAGSGALGFEASSRHAARVVLVERDREVAKFLRDNAQKLGGERCSIVESDARRYLAAPGPGFDVVFLDPPFRGGLLPAILPALLPRLNPGAVVYVESDATFEPGPEWDELRARRAGQVHYRLIAPAHQEERPT